MLAELRADVKTELEHGGFEHAYDYTADSKRVPCVVVLPAPNYLTQGSDEERNTFGEYNVALDVMVLAARDVNKKNAALMDALLEQALGVLLANDRDVVRVTRPVVVTMPESGVKYLGAVITIAETWEAPNGS